MTFTSHRIFLENSGDMSAVADESAHLVVTSPPYPMIEMWDGLFSEADPDIGSALEKGEGPMAFRLMHRVLDQVWDEVWRVLVSGGLACVNIGDATRTIGDDFALYPNHSRILSHLLELGFSALPMIIWRKQTNAPNKFMGSGMLPAGAYVTLEHELILVVRKGARRQFTETGDRERRRTSAIFWEERNNWFSDVWTDLKGARQGLDNGRTRNRSAAFPFELAFRLINMYSLMGDTVIDPFLGTGTTCLAAAAACRNSIGYEADPELWPEISHGMENLTHAANERLRLRLESHRAFVAARLERGLPLKYANAHYGFPVMTNHERQLYLPPLTGVERSGEHAFTVTGEPLPTTPDPASDPETEIT